MPPIGSVTGGFGVMMDAVSTCTRFCARHSNSGCMPFAELLGVGERISADCNSSEVCGQGSNLRLCYNSALPTELPHTTHRLMFPTFISGTYWLSTQSQVDRWKIELHTVCIPTSVLCVINTRPLSDLMISALPFSLLSTIH